MVFLIGYDLASILGHLPVICNKEKLFSPPVHAGFTNPSNYFPPPVSERQGEGERDRTRENTIASLYC